MFYIIFFFDFYFYSFFICVFLYSFIFFMNLQCFIWHEPDYHFSPNNEFPKQHQIIPTCAVISPLNNLTAKLTLFRQLISTSHCLLCTNIQSPAWMQIYRRESLFAPAQQRLQPSRLLYGDTMLRLVENIPTHTRVRNRKRASIHKPDRESSQSIKRRLFRPNANWVVRKMGQVCVRIRASLGYCRMHHIQTC